MKIAIIGAGRWGKNLLKEFNNQAEVVWVAHRGEDETTKLLAENYPSIKSTTNTEDIFNDSSIEAVVIATPTSTHFKVASQALDANKHIFLEKPGTTSSKDLETLVTKAKEKNLKLCIGYIFVHHPAAKKLKELLAGKKITSIRFEWNKWGTFEDSAIPHLLSHELAVMKYFGLNNLQLHSFDTKKVISDTDITITTFSSGDTAITSVINRVAPNKQKTVTILLEQGGYVWSNGDLFEIDVATKALTSISLPETTPLAEEVKNFLSSIEEQKEPLVNGSFALDIYHTLDTIK
jgi:predicted dehydrogenase